MDLFDAARYFDGMAVTDAYDASALFTGQMDQYQGTERDSMTGWRRSISAPAVTVPDRGAVSINGNIYLTGRTVEDYFQTEVIRTHLLLHPSDGLFTRGWAKAFIAEDDENLTEAYAALAIRKEQKEESESSQFFSLYNIYIATSESVTRDQLVQSPDGVFFRVQSVEPQTGGFVTLYVSELETNTLIELSYYVAGEYDVTSDTVATEPAESISGFLERYQTNYRYTRWASEKFKNGDAVVTINADDIADPRNNDRIVIGSTGYRVLERQSDTQGCWELHVRPTEFNLVVET